MVITKSSVIRRFSSVQIYSRTEHNAEGILSETTWSLLNKLAAKDGVAATSGTIKGLKPPTTSVSNPKVGDGSANVDCVSHESKNSCVGCPNPGTKKVAWKNICFSTTCKGEHPGTLKWNPKGTAEGEWSCDRCDTDYCANCGRSKTYPPGADGRLEKCPNSEVSLKAGGLLKAEGDENYIVTKPGRIIVSGFGCNIPLNARINKIHVDYKAWVKNTSGTETKIPNIPGVMLKLNDLKFLTDNKSLPFYGTDRVMSFPQDYIEDITPLMLNQKDFNVTFNPMRNTSINSGVMYVDYIDLWVDITPPKYSLDGTITTSTIDSRTKKVRSLIPGDYITFKCNIKNTNKADHGHTIPVTITTPSGLSYISDNGTYDNNTKKWNVKLDANSKATITIKFKALTTGNKTVKASIDGFNTTFSKTAVIKNPTNTIYSTLPQKITQGHTVVYHVKLTSNSYLNQLVQVNIPIPEGFEYHSSDSSYNPISQVWTASFPNQSDTSVLQSDSVAITLMAVDPGIYTQTITAVNAKSISNKITVLGSELGECNYVEVPLPDSLRVYMQDQVEYFVSCEMEIVSALTGEVYEGYNNFALALILGANEEEKEDETELIGSAPTFLNRYERVFAQFVYDQNATLTIRLYGQYAGLNPDAYNVRFGKWSISNLSEDFEQSGGLFDDPSCLCGDGNYALLNLDGGESSKPIILGNINLAGRESDSDIIVNGMGVTLDYICNTPSTVNITISDGFQVSTQSSILDPTQSILEIGGEFDKWDLKNIDLENLKITVSITNTDLNPQSIQLKNIQFTLYSSKDETGNNPGIIVDGEHSRNYGIFLNMGDSTKNEGLASELSVYDISNTSGDLITGFDFKSKEFTLKFEVRGCTLEEAQQLLIEAAKYLSNDRDPNTKLPIPKTLKFEWDTREYNVIFSKEIKADLEIATYKCEVGVTIPDGIGFIDLKTSGAIGTNEGLIDVRPLITLITQGGKVQIFDNVSYKSLTINHNFEAGITLTVDCDARTIIGDDGEDYSLDITLNSTWPEIIASNAFDLTSSTGGLIQTVQFKEGK